MSNDEGQTMTILHVSDFHFRGDGRSDHDRKLVLEPLLEKIQEISRSPDWQPKMVVCTGDVAFSGLADEYAVATKFFTRLLQMLGLSTEALFIVPGNHDIDLSKAASVHSRIAEHLGFASFKDLREALLRGSANTSEFVRISNMLFDDDVTFRTLVEKYSGYQQFVGTLGRPFGLSPFCFSELVDAGPGLLVGIVGLNSTWMFENLGKQSEQMQQIMGTRPLLEAFNVLRDKQQARGRNADLVVVAYHHPTEGLYEAERGTVKAELGQRADLLLEGHQDTPDQQFYEWVRPSKMGAKKTVVLQEGPAYEGSHYPNRVEFVRYEQSDLKKAVEVKSMKYETPTHKWVMDTSTFSRHETADGHGYFLLWEAPVPHKGVAVSGWDEFFARCHKFDEGRFYLLVIGETSDVLAKKRALARVDWSLVLDFDPSTDTKGAYQQVQPELGMARAVHLLTLEDQISFNPERATYWIAAAGLSSRPTTLAGQGWRAWNRRYSQALRSILQRFSDSCEERPITVVIVWSETDYVRLVCEAVDGIFGGSAEIVFAVSRTEPISFIADTFGASVVPMSLSEVCTSIQEWLIPRAQEVQSCELPVFNSRVPAVFSVEDQRWLEEELEIAHLGVGRSAQTGEDPGRDFLRGKEVSWFELAMHYDIDREKTSTLQQMVERDLSLRSIARINLYHWPGAGGTTVARRVAWNLHGTYPTVRLTRANGEQTVGRLRRIYEATQQPPLVIVEAAHVSTNAVEGVFSEVRRRPFPIVFLQVVRRFEWGGRVAERNVRLDSTLSLPEANRFVQTYGREVPARRDPLERVLRGDAHHRTAFYFGLTAFGKDFASLDDYVRQRLKAATDIQKRVVVHMALIHHYAHKPTPIQIFARLIGTSENRVVDLEKVLSEPLLDLLIRETHGVWRPAHELISVEIIEQVLSGDATDRRVWVQALSTWAKGFASLVAARDRGPGEALMELMRYLYIYREQRELLGTEFARRERYAPLIEDIPSSEGKHGVLRHLVEQFPRDPHFWAHLGRFLMLERGDASGAVDAINQAIALRDGDYVLHHIKGMIIGRQAILLMERCEKEGECPEEELQEIRGLVDEAGEQFSRSRELAPDEKEHGYISHINLLIRAVDFGFVMSKSTSRGAFVTAPESNWYQQQLDKAEGLLEEVENLREGESPSGYTIQCRARLRQQYGDFADALRHWRAMLGRADIYQPLVRREIVRTHLNRVQRKWDRLGEREIQDILDLMEQNVEEEKTSDTNVRLWFQAARHSNRCGIEEAIERFSYWRANTGALDAVFYLYILYALQAIDGSSSFARSRAEGLIGECSQKARAMRIGTHTISIEWLSKGTGLKRIVNYSSLLNLEEELDKGSKLELTDGHIAAIYSPVAGEVELLCGLRAFFTPSPRKGNAYVRGRDENKPVKFYLGFSYSGLRAWSVRDVDYI